MSKSIPDQFFERLKNQQQTEQDQQQFAAWLRTATEAEIEAVLDKYGWYFESQTDEPLVENSRLAALIESKINESESRVDLNTGHTRYFTLKQTVKRLAVAAALAGALCIYYFNSSDNRPQKTTAVAKAGKIVPGGNKATLTLADGSVIKLDSVANGMLASQNNVRIYKEKNGQIVYDVSQLKTIGEGKLDINTISTPRGGQYQIILPDGSKVWLNAESTLKYPAHFVGKERNVELTGEAYFEVAKDKLHPFKVDVNNMQVEVLGTHFNIMAYKDEVSTKTTLLEGSVRIINGADQKLIVPGEQAIVKGGIAVARVNVNEAVEWKNGNFNFAHERLESIMRKIARWYDVDIAYKGKTTNASFVGTIPRSEDITEVLKYLELTGLVHFKIEERRLTAMP